jgi:beta-lactamase regulating signal transducer with metallopeptidase domain
MISTVIEAACRSLLVALAVWIGLRAFRVRNVLAQKAAWALVLAAAVLMPLLLPLASRWQILPARAAFVLPADPQTLLEELQARIRSGSSSVRKPPTVLAPAPQSAPQPASQSAPSRVEEKGAPVAVAPSRPIAARPTALPVEPDSYKGAPDSFNAAPDSFHAVPNDYSPQPLPQVPSASLSPAMLALWIYLSITALLFARLLYGLVAALYVWRSATPIQIGSPLADNLHLRSSHKIASPVTIGSAIVLPADYITWETEKLRVVLAHERSHIRQGDFYVQLLAELYSALVWFSPLGWWIKNKLSDLAEMISDRAGLNEAASLSSYAQVLLQFAAAPRPTPIGVAMARTGTVSRRIDRLLNDSAFRQSFSGGRRALVAVLLVPIALFVSTAFIRVHAAGQNSPAAPQAPAAPPAPTAPSDAATPEADAVVEPDQAAPAPDAQLAPPAPEAPTQPGQIIVLKDAPPPAVVPDPPSTFTLDFPEHMVTVLPPSFTVKIPKFPAIAPMTPMTLSLRDNIDSAILLAQNNATILSDGFGYLYSNNGDSYALISGDDRTTMNFSGEIHTGDIDKVRKMAHGDFLWFKHNGKAYFVDDPAAIAQIEAMYQPMKELGKQQEALGKQQEELGKQQAALGKSQEQASVSMPDLTQEKAQLDAALAKLQQYSGKTVTQDQLAELQARLALLQARLGSIDGEMGARMGQVWEKQGSLGAMQGKLGAEQGRLGAEQGRLAAEANRKVRSIIDQSLRDGKAHPVN